MNRQHDRIIAYPKSAVFRGVVVVGVSSLEAAAAAAANENFGFSAEISLGASGFVSASGFEAEIPKENFGVVVGCDDVPKENFGGPLAAGRLDLKYENIQI